MLRACFNKCAFAAVLAVARPCDLRGSRQGPSRQRIWEAVEGAPLKSKKGRCCLHLYFVCVYLLFWSMSLDVCIDISFASGSFASNCCLYRSSVCVSFAEASGKNKLGAFLDTRVHNLAFVYASGCSCWNLFIECLILSICLHRVCLYRSFVCIKFVCIEFVCIESFCVDI